MMKRITICLLGCVGWFGILTAQTSATGAPLPRDRAQTWDFWIPISYQLSTTLDGESGSEVKVKDSVGLGFGFGYNFNNQLQVGGLFDWGYRPYTASAVGEDGSTRQYRNDLEMGSFLANATYYFLPQRFSPFISGSMGYTYLDTNIPTGEPGYTICYWDPWWGYICETARPTRTEDGFSYGLGLGLRYDISDAFGLQFAYTRQWVDTSLTSGTPDFDNLALSFMLRY